MKNTRNKTNRGIKKLIRSYKRQFRIPENLEHYKPADFARAEKQFVKLCLRQGAPPVGSRRPI